MWPGAREAWVKWLVVHGAAAAAKILWSRPPLDSPGLNLKAACVKAEIPNLLMHLSVPQVIMISLKKMLCIPPEFTCFLFQWLVCIFY